MYAPATRPMTFEEFLECYPEDGRRYEPFDGEVVEMRFKIKREVASSLVSAKSAKHLRFIISASTLSSHEARVIG